jgi:hypothetical protein
MRYALLAWALLAAPAAAQTVDGQVVNSVTGSGIGGATVYLVQGDQIVYTASTGDLGHFHLDGVKQGAYSWNYKAAGFLTAGLRGAAPSLEVGSEPAHLRIELIPSCKVSGRVVDGAGSPVPDARIELRLATPGGRMTFGTTTDAKGAFSRTEQLPAGALTITAWPPTSLKPPEPRDGQELGWTQTYYPNVTHLDLAARIPLTAGSEPSGLDIKLVAAPVHHLRGVIFDPQGRPAAKASLILVRDALSNEFVRQETKSDGTFDVPALVDGGWRVSARLQQDGVKLWAGQEIEMKGRDLENVELRLTAPFTLRGKMVYERAAGVAASMTAGGMILEYSGNRSGIAKMPDGPLFTDFSILASNMDEHGELIVANMYPGSYMIAASNPPPQYYLHSIQLGGRDITGTYVPIQSGAAPVIVTYKQNGGTVRGSVEACGGGRVTLMPQAPEWRRAEFLPLGNCSNDGRYEIGAIRPGEYYAIALPKRDAMLTADEFDQSLINQSTKVTVRANETTTVDLRLSQNSK